jgi:HD superfamily phosphohydrolase
MQKGKLCIEKGGLEAAEYLLVARFMMFSAVYLHRTVRIATAMLYRAIESAIADGTISPEQFAEADDEGALALISGSNRGSRYANALTRRRLYKEICSLPKEGWDETKARKFEAKLSKEFGFDILFDYPHKFVKEIDFMVDTDDGLKPITKLSKLVKSLREAEEERMQILVLAEENKREKFSADVLNVIEKEM